MAASPSPPNPLPFEFTVVGPPLSARSKRRDRLEQWQAKIRHAALRHWPSYALPVNHPVELSVICYSDSLIIPNTEIIQPIQEALSGLAYLHSRCVSDTVSRGRDMSRGVRIRGVTPALAEGLGSKQEFLHIKVVAAPQLERSDKASASAREP